MSFSLLDKINSPSDLRSLGADDIPRLADEIREFLVDTVCKNGGHLASNLGVVELTLALHRVFDSPRDHIIFDVGHQSYVHKLITGRRDRFSTLRTPGGLSGFTVRRESSHDPFGAGHSSTAVSAALGFAEADLLIGNQAYTVCVVGDGAYTGGMTHEALNNVKKELPLIIVLNENGMSISKNCGSFASYLTTLPVSEGYFEKLGLNYIGRIEGNDYSAVEAALKKAKDIGGATVVHIVTRKGKGYFPAELSPDTYHNVVPADTSETFGFAFADELCRYAASDKRIAAVTAATGLGTGLCGFAESFPERYFDVGIAEGHALTFSAGLAAAGMSPFVAIYSTFLQRGYDSILHDIALQNLPVKIIIDRAGLSVSDGATHHGIFDVSFLSHIPNIRIFTPATYSSLLLAMRYAMEADSPVAIRYANSPESEIIRNSFVGISDNLPFVKIDFDTSELPEYFFVTYGQITERVVSAKEILRKSGIRAGIILLEELKPYSDVAGRILPLISGAKRLVLVEEGIRNGGASQILKDELTELGIAAEKIDIAAIEDSFASPEGACDLYDFVGLSPTKIAEKMVK